jgi:hypothetical protein
MLNFTTKIFGGFLSDEAVWVAKSVSTAEVIGKSL